MEALNNTVEIQLEELKENIDAVFLMIMAIFLCFMQAGFALLEAGSIRSKNVTNILMKNTMDIFISCMSYWAIGYALAYGEGNPFIGYNYFFIIDLPPQKVAHWFFQFIFAATAATIVSGAVAERCNFKAYIVYSFVISGFIYPVVSHWAWSDTGWLANLGFQDFAGSGVVHLVGGTSSLIAASLLGPRIGRFEGKPMPGHSVALTGLGGMILIAGFLAFNGGSLGNMTSENAGSTIATVISNTVMSGAGAAFTSMILLRIGLCGPHSWSFLITLNASLTGLVSVCAAADNLFMWNSFVTGCVAAVVFLIFRFLLPLFKVDDPLDAIAVHMGGGLWGLVSGPIFKKGGIVYSLNSEAISTLESNLLGALAILSWTSTLCLVMFGTLKIFKSLRISEKDELIGLDIAKHKESAYPTAGWEQQINISTIRTTSQSY